jgi:E3 ubiquitin-protein ligase HUWE1
VTVPLDSGIDPEFLEALPEDLRSEVFNQHLQEQRQRASNNTFPVENSDISDFLNALPADIRQEVLFQQRESSSNQNATPQTVIPPPSIFSYTGNRPTLGGAVQSRSSAARTPAPKVQRRDAVQLVDKAALMTLLRLLFVPEPCSKSVLHRLLLNLSENGKTRADLISLFLSILADGSSDLTAVDRSFALLSIRGKGKVSNFTPKKNSTGRPSFVMDSAPNLVAQRCCEALLFLVSNNEQMVTFFLSENEGFSISFSKQRSSKKGKGKEKEKMMGSNFPIVVLLGLLERTSLLSHPSLLEQVVHLLSILLRPISTITSTTEKAESAVTATSSTAQPSTASTSSNALESTEPSSTSSSSKALGISTDIKEAPLTPPSIPDQYFGAIVRVLTYGECSSKIFQHTLSSIHHLSAIANYKYALLSELTESAQNLGVSMIEDLKEVGSILKSTQEFVDVNKSVLSKFGSSSAQQAKLLRVLKTIDFIYSNTHQSDEQTLSVSVSSDPQASSGSSTTSFANQPPLPSTPAAVSNNLVDGAEKFQFGDEGLSALYNRLNFTPVWRELSSCLDDISKNEVMEPIGTIILPLIEAFMVISKPFVTKAAIHRLLSQSSSVAILSPTANMMEMAPDDFFFLFTEQHKKLLNSMVRTNPSLLSGSFSLLIKNPKVLEFDNKRTFFNQQLHKKSGRDHYGAIQINVRRAFVFDDSYHQLHGRTGDEIKYGKLNVRFHEEEGVDAGGVAREWYSVLARQMFNPNYALFKPSAVDKVTYQPNRSSWINSEHLSYFKFVGRIIGKAIYDGRLLDCYFTRSFYKCMVEMPVDWKDIEALDPEFHKSLEWMLQNDITDVIDLTFSTEVDEFGRTKIIDLKPNGRNIAVTEENKFEYVKLITEQKLITAIKQQIDAFLAGFHDIIPKDLIKIFNEQELELLISGLPDIDIDDWKNNTEYQNYTPASPQIQWFWRAVRSFSQEERAKLIQFSTGTSKVPLEGFKALEGSNGVQKFQIHKNFAKGKRLPSAHTWCVKKIYLIYYCLNKLFIC